MLHDFWFIHADVIRNSIVLLILVGGGSFITILITRWVYRKKAYREADEHLKQKNVELRIELRAVKETNEKLLATIERLTRVQNAAVGAANTVHEIVKEIEA